MADFVDYTNVTEFEKFTFKLSSVMKEMIELGTECEKGILFRDVDFRVSLVESKEDSILKGIPHFRFSSGLLEKCFNLPKYWLLECTEKGRIVSEATGRLLLSSMIQTDLKDHAELAMFIRIGEVEVSEKFIGFLKSNSGKCEYFETFVQGREVKVEEEEIGDLISSAQVVLEWFPGNLRVNYPGFTGHFDSRHVVERIELKCIWPKIPKNGLKFKREDCLLAPIWVASYEEVEESEKLPLRNSMLRSIQSSHLREVLFTSMGKIPLISIPVHKKEWTVTVIDSPRALYEAIAMAYRNETERLDNDVTNRFNFIPKRVLDTMRWERLNETFAMIWRKFIKTVEAAWNDLSLINLDLDLDLDLKCFDGTGEIENGLKLVNWCIERELEWQESLNRHSLLRKLYKIPLRHLYNELSVDEKIEAMKEKIGTSFEELKIELNEAGGDCNEDCNEQDDEDEDEFKDLISDEEDSINCADVTDDKESHVFEHGFDIGNHLIYEPVILNCEPPSNKLMTKSLLKNPLAGDVIAVNQLREDMRVFRAWNEEICRIKCSISEPDGVVDVDAVEGGSFDFGFIGFLLWHSPNDIEKIDGTSKFKISQRMRDVEGQWLKIWAECGKGQQERGKRCSSLSLNQQVSFNHRAMLGQVISDLALKTDLNLLLESATPFLTRRAAELLSPEASEIVKSLEFEVKDGKYPLDVINAELDGFEKKMTRSLTLQALCSQIFEEDEVTEVLVSGGDEREFLLNVQHDFKILRKEIVCAVDNRTTCEADTTVDSEDITNSKDESRYKCSDDSLIFRELLGGFEGIRVKLPY